MAIVAKSTFQKKQKTKTKKFKFFQILKQALRQKLEYCFKIHNNFQSKGKEVQIKNA